MFWLSEEIIFLSTQYSDCLIQKLIVLKANDLLPQKPDTDLFYLQCTQHLTEKKVFFESSFLTSVAGRELVQYSSGTEDMFWSR